LAARPTRRATYVAESFDRSVNRPTTAQPSTLLTRVTGSEVNSVAIPFAAADAATDRE
jgi:hypothetical protein